MHFFSAQNLLIFTAISTAQVKATTITSSKKVRRFLLVGRVVRKKLRRAMQERLEAVKESRQRRAVIPGVTCSDPSFWSSLNVLSSGIELVLKSIPISFFSCLSHTSSLSAFLIGNGRLGVCEYLSSLALPPRRWSHYSQGAPNLIFCWKSATGVLKIDFAHLKGPPPWWKPKLPNSSHSMYK